MRLELAGCAIPSCRSRSPRLDFVSDGPKGCLVASETVRVSFDGTSVMLPAGDVSVRELRRILSMAESHTLAAVIGEVERSLDESETIVVKRGAAFFSFPALIYRPSPKHKRVPSRGVKGTICPHDVDPIGLLRSSYALVPKPDQRWATVKGCAFCARSDNAGAWHGYPVQLSHVPAQIWRLWLEEGKINLRDLRYDKLCEG